MHAIHFQLKRAHLSTTRFAQNAVKRIEGMTPARYDILALLREHAIFVLRMPKRSDINSMTQRTITERLGLHRSTVSKMLIRMEQMGWIERKPDREGGDRRLKRVDLTALGLRRAWRAMRRVYRSRLLLAPFERIARQLRPKAHAVAAVTSVWDDIEAIARFFGDTSWFFYPWEFGCLEGREYTFPTPETAKVLDPRGPRTTYLKIQEKRRFEMAVRFVRRLIRNRTANWAARNDAWGSAQES